MKIVKCRGCGESIVFMPTIKGNSNPVDVESFPVPEGVIAREYIEQLPATTVFDRNKHTSHFLTCPKSSRFGKAKQKPKKESKPEPENTQELLL